MHRSLATFFLFAMVFLAPGSLARADGGGGAQPANNNSNAKSGDEAANASANASAPEVKVRTDVEQLRQQLADQQKTIDQLRSMVQQLVDAKAQAAGTDAAHAQSVSFTLPTDSGETEMFTTAQTDKKDAPVTAGWNGEHFYLKSPDGLFTLLPVGYLNTNYSFYHGDGAPPNTFTVRRARFGVLGTYGPNVDYAFLFDAAATNGLSIRDMYVNFKPWRAFQIQAGQFKEPFSQEIGTGITNVEFLERSFVTVLYPSAAGVFRAPGIAAHGDIHGGVVQYWIGAFNGKGIIANNTTNEPDYVGRLRFSPWRNKKNALFQGFTFGGSIAHSRTRGISNELSFSGVINDSAFTFFPQFRLNGGIERYNGEFLWLKGRWGLRGEYTQILEKRDNLGSITPGGIGFESLPGVVGKGAYIYTTYLLTGEREPENAIPKVKHPVIGPATPGESGTPGWGAWQLKARYSWLEGKAGGQNFPSQFSPESVPTFSDHVDQISMGVNWYLNYWVLVKLDFNIDRLRNPSVQGILPQNYYVALQGLQFRF